MFPGQPVGGVLGRDLLPSNFDLEVYKGDFLPLEIDLLNPDGTPLNLTGYIASAQIRANFGDPVIYNFTAEIPAPTTGVVKLTLPSTVSAGIAPGHYVWDFQVTDGSGNVRTYLAGDVTVFNEVTK